MVKLALLLDQANSAHVRQSRLDSGLGFEAEVVETFNLFPVRTEAGGGGAGRTIEGADAWEISIQDIWDYFVSITAEVFIYHEAMTCREARTPTPFSCAAENTCLLCLSLSPTHTLALSFSLFLPGQRSAHP